MKRTVISIFTIAALGGALLFVAFSIAFPGGNPLVASAQTTGTTAQQLQAEIQALNAQITALQARLGGISSTPSTAGGFPATGSIGVGYAFTPGSSGTSGTSTNSGNPGTGATSTASFNGGPVIVSISPTGGNAGAAVTITGSGFGATTTVFMNGELAARTASVRSSSTVSFIVPISLTPGCTAQSSTAANGSTTATFACTGTAHLEGPGTYEITVGVNGVMSNAMPFQLTGNSYYNTP